MTYTAVFLSIFLKQFKKLPSNDSSRIRQRVKDLCDEPYNGLRLKGDLDGFWKDRVGNYRIIYKIEENEKKIVFYDVGVRKNIYD